MEKNELLVLSLLMHWPLHAYKLAGIANNIIGPEEEISRGTLSTLLGRLEQAGLIAEADPATTPFSSERQTRVLAITSAGRERFQALMLDTSTAQGPYSKVFAIKALHLEFLAHEQQLYLVEHYLAYCRRLLEVKQKQRAKHASDPIRQNTINAAFRQAALDLMQRKIEEWRGEIAWVESLRDRINAQLHQG